MCPRNPKYVQEAFDNATLKAHSYLLFDFTQTTPDELRLRTEIFPGENCYVYIPK